MVPQHHMLFGGTSASEYFLCKALVELGHEVTLFASDVPPGRYLRRRAKRFASQKETEGGFTVRRLFAIANLGGDMPIMPRLMADMRAVDADLIHVHEYYNYGSAVGRIVSRAKKVPFTYTQDRYYSVKRRIWNPFFKLVNSSLLGVVRNAPRLATAFSVAAAEFLSQQGYPRSRIRVIPLSIDSERFAPSRDSWLRDSLGIREDPLVMSVARLHPSKNLETLIQAVALASVSIRKLKLVIVGRGPQLNYLRSLISNLGLEERVLIVTEPVSYEKMPGLYNSSDLFVLPSLYEPFGLSVVEAMACAKPVIVSDVGGMRDTVLDGEVGFRVPLLGRSDFIKALASRITQLLVNPDFAGKLGRAGRKRAQLLYNHRTIARRYEEFYRILVSQTSGKASR